MAIVKPSTPEFKQFASDMSALAFDESTHSYTLRGAVLPSVTQVMRPMSLMLYESISASTLNNAADRGTRAHDAISNIVHYGIEESDEDTAPYIHAFNDFELAYSPAWIASEMRAYHKTLMYSGTLDLIGYIDPDDGTGVDVVDIKTTRAPHQVMLGTQVSAYAEIIKSHGVTVRSLYGLHLKPDGKFGLYRLENRYATFLHCLAIANAMKEEKHA